MCHVHHFYSYSVCHLVSKCSSSRNRENFCYADKEQRLPINLQALFQRNKTLVHRETWEKTCKRTLFFIQSWSTRQLYCYRSHKSEFSWLVRFLLCLILIGLDCTCVPERGFFCKKQHHWSLSVSLPANAIYCLVSLSNRSGGGIWKNDVIGQ